MLGNEIRTKDNQINRKKQRGKERITNEER